MIPASIYHITSSLLVFPARVPDIMQQRQAILTLYCPSSWPTESLKKIDICHILRHRVLGWLITQNSS